MTLNRHTIHHRSISALSPLSINISRYLHPSFIPPSWASRSFFLSLCHPTPNSLVRLLVMLSPFKSGCHHYSPTRTQFPPSHPSLCLPSYPLLISSPLLRLNPPLEIAQPVFLTTTWRQTLKREDREFHSLCNLCLGAKSLPSRDFMFICVKEN